MELNPSPPSFFSGNVVYLGSEDPVNICEFHIDLACHHLVSNYLHAHSSVHSPLNITNFLGSKQLSEEIKANADHR